jgi:hypothetical protein
MHFDFTVSLGQVLTIATLLGMSWKANRVISKYLYEHELLMQDYCDRNKITLSGLPTRIKR